MQQKTFDSFLKEGKRFDCKYLESLLVGDGDDPVADLSTPYQRRNSRTRSLLVTRHTRWYE